MSGVLVLSLPGAVQCVYLFGWKQLHAAYENKADESSERETVKLTELTLYTIGV